MTTAPPHPPPPLRTFLSSPSPPGSRTHSQPPPPTESSTPLERLPPGSLATPHDAHPEPQPTLAKLRQDVRTKGYCTIPAFLSASRISHLHAAASTMTTLARRGAWPYVRTLPRQFPPWDTADAKEKGIWGVQHLLHPDVPRECWKEFAGLYFDPGLLELCLGLMRGEEEAGAAKDEELQEGTESLVMELLNLLVTPKQDFELRWHRDSVPFEGVSVEEEADMLGLGAKGSERVAHHVQYNIALESDASLYVVPGSHLRVRTAAEVQALEKSAYAKELPGMVAVETKPGDVLFYDNNIIHTGRYKADVQRLTLHGCVGDVRGGTGRAQNILQHGVGEWVNGLHVEELKGENSRRAEGMRRNLMELGRKAGRDARKGIYNE